MKEQVVKGRRLLLTTSRQGDHFVGVIKDPSTDEVLATRKTMKRSGGNTLNAISAMLRSTGYVPSSLRIDRNATVEYVLPRH